MAFLFGSHQDHQEMLRRARDITDTFGKFKPTTFTAEIKECIEIMKEMEQKRVRFLGDGPNIGSRQDMVLFIRRVANAYNFSTATIFHAIYIYDRYQDRANIVSTEFQLVALTCLILAGKLEEPDWKTPKITKMKMWIEREKGQDYSYLLFTEMERRIMKSFNYNLMAPTEAQFLEFFLLYGLDGVMHGMLYKPFKKWVNENGGGIRYSDLLTSLYENSKKVLRIICVKLPSEYPVSLVAAAVLMFVRRLVHLNFWTGTLTNVTSYTINDVCWCMKRHVEPAWDAEYPWSNTQKRELPLYLNL